MFGSFFFEYAVPYREGYIRVKIREKEKLKSRLKRIKIRQMDQGESQR